MIAEIKDNGILVNIIFTEYKFAIVLMPCNHLKTLFLSVNIRA